MQSPARKAIALALLGAMLAACDGGSGGRGLVEGVPGSSAATPAITDAPEIELPPRRCARSPPACASRGASPPCPTGPPWSPNEATWCLPATTRAGLPRIMSITPAGEVAEVQRLSEVDLRWGEGGLPGIVVSPNYAADKWVYVYYSTADDNRIARLLLGEPPQPILTGIPVSGDDGRFHQGGRLAFGPDGMLYASVGETYFDSEIAQDRNALGGKILRITSTSPAYAARPSTASTSTGATPAGC